MKCQNTVRQLLQISGDRRISLTCLPDSVFQFSGSVRRLLHSGSGFCDLAEHRFCVSLRHLACDLIPDFYQSALSHLRGNIIRSRICFAEKFHFLRMGVHKCRRIGRKILWNGNDHIISSVGKSPAGLCTVHKIKIQGIVFFQGFCHFPPYIQRRSFIIRLLIKIDYRHGKFVQISVWVPHGFQKQSCVNHRDQNYRRDHYQQNLIF